jgi:acyl carrier protein
MQNDILTKLESYIAANILKQPGRSIPAQESIISSGMIDSFRLVDLALFVEDTFGVRIDDTELNADTFDSLEVLTKLIAQRQV